MKVSELSIALAVSLEKNKNMSIVAQYILNMHHNHYEQPNEIIPLLTPLLNSLPDPLALSFSVSSIGRRLITDCTDRLLDVAETGEDMADVRGKGLYNAG